MIRHKLFVSVVTSLMIKLHHLTRKNSLVNQVEFSWVSVHLSTSVTKCNQVMKARVAA